MTNQVLTQAYCKECQKSTNIRVRVLSISMYTPFDDMCITDPLVDDGIVCDECSTPYENLSKEDTAALCRKAESAVA